MVCFVWINCVLYVNFIYSIGGVLLYKEVCDCFLLKFMWCKDVEGEFYEYLLFLIFLLIGILLVFFLDVMDCINGFLFLCVLKWYMEVLGFENLILWIFNVRWFVLLDGIEIKLCVYDCIDEWGSWLGYVGGLGW